MYFCYFLFLNTRPGGHGETYAEAGADQPKLSFADLDLYKILLNVSSSTDSTLNPESLNPERLYVQFSLIF